VFGVLLYSAGNSTSRWLLLIYWDDFTGGVRENLTGKYSDDEPSLTFLPYPDTSCVGVEAFSLG